MTDDRLPSPSERTDRLRRMSALSRLRIEERLVPKIGYSPSEVTARLRRQSELRAACLRWARRNQV